MKKLFLLFAILFISIPLIGQDWGEEVPYGTEYTIIATPNEGWEFLNWMENGEVISTNPVYTFTVTGQRSFIANFKRLNFIIQVQVNPLGGGQVEGSGVYPADAEVKLHAIPYESYNFENFTELNSGDVITENPYWFLAKRDEVITANFSSANEIQLKWWVVLGICGLLFLILILSKKDEKSKDKKTGHIN